MEKKKYKRIIDSKILIVTIILLFIILTMLSQGIQAGLTETAERSAAIARETVPTDSIRENALVPLKGVRKTLAVGETWDFAFGYSIGAQSIDARARPRQAWIIIRDSDGVIRDNAVVREGEFYDYVNDYRGYEDLLIFRIKMSRIFAGPITDMVELNDNYAGSLAIDSCNPSWSCSSTQCLNYKINRYDCVDSHRCHKLESRPPEIESCQDSTTLTTGETWDLQSYSMQVHSVDAKATPRQAWISILKEGVTKDDAIVKEGEVYDYVEKGYMKNDVVIFSTRTDSIFAAATSDMVTFKDTYLFDATPCECKQVWTCGEWNKCFDGRKTRTCTDLANCDQLWTASDLDIDCDVGLPLTEIVCDTSQEHKIFPKFFIKILKFITNMFKSFTEEKEKFEEEPVVKELAEVPEVAPSKEEEEKACSDKCAEDGCSGKKYVACVLQKDGCKDKVDKSLVKGKCGVECFFNFDCDNGKECVSNKCGAKTGLNLNNFPSPFLKDTIIVVGAKASSTDVLASVEIATILQNKVGKEVPKKLDDEISGQEKNYNLILIGTPCDNPVVEKVFNIPCESFDLEDNNAVIKLTTNGGKTAMLVAGKTPVDTLTAAKKVANYESQDLEGSELTI